MSAPTRLIKEPKPGPEIETMHRTPGQPLLPRGPQGGSDPRGQPPGPTPTPAPPASVPGAQPAHGSAIARAGHIVSSDEQGADAVRAVGHDLSAATDTHPEIDRDTPHVLEIEQFRLFYGSAQALYDVTMRIPAGKVAALIGPSGCGKSTLLRSINRLNDLVDAVRIEGSMRLAGDDIYDRQTDVIALRKRIGMVFQKSNPFPKSIFENVVYGLRVFGEKRRPVLEQACERALKDAALWNEVKDRLHESALALSGGQQQRLCIARAVAPGPEILLMDEPCSALDPIATSKIEELIASLRGVYTVIIVTHNMQQASRVSDYTAFMYLGRLIEYGPTEAIFQNPRRRETEDYVTGRFG